VGDTTAAGEAVESWDEIRDERNGLQYAVASWLTLALRAYLAALETGAEVEPMEIAGKPHARIERGMGNQTRHARALRP
jgi:hypothetical protein